MHSVGKVVLWWVKSSASHVAGFEVLTHPSVLHVQGGVGLEVPVEQTCVCVPGAVKLCMQNCCVLLFGAAEYSA
eukprot:COSAG02_NODE_50476_length_320_cov_0.705882_1_plen_73_part_01